MVILFIAKISECNWEFVTSYYGFVYDQFLIPSATGGVAMREDAFFRISNEVRYVAFYLGGQLTLHERPGLANSSTPESDKYEELIVNPTLLTLVQQRGNIDCGGAKFVVIRYGNFWQTVWPVDKGHVSVGLELTADPLAHAKEIQRVCLAATDSARNVTT
jgi:hypothetical protein